MHIQPIRICLLALIAAGACALAAPPAAATEATAPTPPRRTADAALVRALQDHDWTLRAAVDASGKPVDALLVPGHPFALRFDGTVSLDGQDLTHRPTAQRGFCDRFRRISDSRLFFFSPPGGGMIEAPIQQKEAALCANAPQRSRRAYPWKANPDTELK